MHHDVLSVAKAATPSDHSRRQGSPQRDYVRRVSCGVYVHLGRSLGDARADVISSSLMPLDTTTLQMALVGYGAERQKVQAKIAELRRQLGSRAAIPVAVAPAKRGTRRMSAAARKRIAAAQKKRWAAFHKKQKAV